jgi:hypothetical protein
MNQTLMTTKRLDNGNVLVTVPITWQFIGNGKVIKGSDAPEKGSNREAILQGIARGRRWQQFLDDGSIKSNLELAQRLGKDESYVARLIRLATVSPAIVRAVINDQLNPMLTLTKLTKSLPETWEEQEKMFLGK